MQCVVTSPPYFGLRDYGTAAWLGGDPDCDHRQQLGCEGATSTKQNTSAGTQTMQYRYACGKCGARRVDQQIGLEATPDAYVAELVAVFREVRRVLKDDGTLWLNLGDSYATGAGGVGDCPGGGKQGEAWKLRGTMTPPNGLKLPGLKSKDLIGIPWRVAFALQADGWYLRSDIIWSKPNPMPESVTDRPTKAHEYLFLLAKSERYYYDSDAIAETAMVIGGRACGPKNDSSRNDSATTQTVRGNGLTRNRRSVWTVPTIAYSGAHFATFPEQLIEPCILAGTPIGGLVLDPFLGSGTVGAVAERTGRRWVGTDLSYQPLSRERTAQRGIRF